MKNSTENRGITFFDIVIVILSIYVLIALIIDSFFKLAPEVSRLLYLIDDLICVIFLYDFTYESPLTTRFLSNL